MTIMPNTDVAIDFHLRFLSLFSKHADRNKHFEHDHSSVQHDFVHGIWHSIPIWNVQCRGLPIEFVELVQIDLSLRFIVSRMVPNRRTNLSSTFKTLAARGRWAKNRLDVFPWLEFPEPFRTLSTRRPSSSSILVWTALASLFLVSTRSWVSRPISTHL